MKHLFAIAALALLTLVPASAESKINTHKGLAVGGYDVVAYFTDSKPVKGSSEFSTNWKGAEWHFASAEHRDTFLKDPDHYAPQYAGYCAYGVSEGHKAPIDPTAWSIVDGKLYLNYNKEVQGLFTKDLKTRIQTADKKWPELDK